MDSSVRACWQIDAEQVTVTGAVWPATFADIVDRAATGLGCPPEHTEAHLYKLLIYEPGGFFAPHRDTEKVDGMVATMVLSLPVASAGGELVIRHKKREAVVDLRSDEPSELAFAAFYADCVHQTRPVSAGHRIVLVYHLVLRKSAADDRLRRAPDFGAHEARVAAQLRKWETSATDGNKLAWLLEHDYSQAGLSFDALKNGDAAVGGALARAARRADQSLHAAILRIEEHGIAAETGGFPGWDDLGKPWEMEEVFQTEVWFEDWIAPDGTRRDYGRVPLLARELLPSGALDDAEPDDEDVNVTGNEGIELSHSYRRAALVLWPEQHTVRTLARGGIGGAVAYVADELARTDADADVSARALSLVTHLIDAWPAPRRSRPHGRYETTDTMQGCADGLRLLRRLGDEATTRRFLHEVATSHYCGEENAELLETVATIAPATLQGWLPGFASAALPRYTEPVLALLLTLCEQETTRSEEAEVWRTALRDAACAACDALPEVVRSDGGSEPAARLEELDYLEPTDRRSRSEELSAHAIRCLFALLWHCDLAEEAEAAVVLFARHPAAAAPDRAVPQALAELAEIHLPRGAAAPAGFAVLWRHAAGFLLARSAKPPVEPRDWVIEADIPCNCPSCRLLKSFCADPVKTTLRLPLRKDLRRHVHGIIEDHGLDLTHETERVGRPYTLVCTKTRAAYERRCAQYAVDIAHMRMLVRAASRAPDAEHEGELRRLRASIQQSTASRVSGNSSDDRCTSLSKGA